MTFLLTIREKIRNFYQQFQQGLNLIFRFIFSLILNITPFLAYYCAFGDVFLPGVILSPLWLVCFHPDFAWRLEVALLSDEKRLA